MKLKIGILALQGAFAEHRKMMESLGAEVIELRRKTDLSKSCNALILPGGESTVQGKLLRELDMFNILKRRITGGLPVMATCAGTILLAEKLHESTVTHFATLPITVAMAAPLTPMSRAKIKMGSRTILMTAPMTVVIILIFAKP